MRNITALMSRRLRPAAVAAGLATIALPLGVRAATWAWDTAPANGNMAGNNWTSGTTPGSGTSTPASGDSLYFGTSSVTTLTNNESSFSFGGIIFNSGASAFTINSNSFTLAGGITNSASNPEVINTPIVLGGSENLSGGAGLSLGGIISGAYNLTGIGTGTVSLANTANTYSGVTVFGSGCIVNVASLSNYGVASSLGNRASSADTSGSTDSSTSGVGLHFLGGTLQYTGTGAQSCNRQIRLLNGNGATIDASGATTASTVSFTYSGANVNLFDTAGTRTLTLTGSNTGTNTFAISLQDQASNPTSLQKSGAGTWVITATNSYSGNTTINAGTLVIGGAGQLGGGTYATAITNNGALVYNSTANQTLSGVISGSGSLTQAGSGRLTLTAGNTYAGAVTVSGGILMVATGASPTNNAVAVTPATGTATLGVIAAGGNTQWSVASLSFNAGGSGTALQLAFNTAPSTTTAPLKVTGNLTFGVTPAVTVDVANLTAGVYPLVVVGGTAPSAVPALTLAPAGRVGTLSGSLAWGGSGFGANTLVLTVTGSSSEPLYWKNSTAGNWDVNDTTNLVWTNSASTYYQENGFSYLNDGVVFADANITASPTVTLSSTVTPASLVFNNSTYAYTVSGSGAIAGPVTLTKSGTAAVTLSTANTYTGGTVINAGSVNTGVAGGLGTAGVTIAGSGTLNLTAGGVAYAGPGSGLNGSGTVNVTTGSGTSAVSLNGTNSGFAGTLNIGVNSTGGKVQLDGSLAAGATVNVLSNSTVYVNGPTQTCALFLYGGTTGETLGQARIEAGAIWTGPVTIAGPIIGAGDGTIGANSGTGYIAGNIGQSGGTQPLIKIGGGTDVLSGTNSYTGPTIVNGGTLDIIGNQTNATGSFYAGTNGATVNLNLGLPTQTVPTYITVASTNTVEVLSPGTTYSTINTYATNGVPTYVTNNGTLLIGRDSGFSINAYAVWVQNSNFVLQANGGYPGNFTIGTNGTFIYNSAFPAVLSAPISSGSASVSDSGNFVTATNIIFNDNGSSGYPNFQLVNGGTLTLGNNFSPLFVSSQTNATSPLGQVQVGTNGTINTAGYSTTITNRMYNASGANGSLVINGGGTVTLTDTNAYTGGTTVNASTLVLANGGAYGVVINNLTLNSNAVVQANNTDAFGYWGGICVSNVNINNSTLTNNSGGNEGYGISYVLNNGLVSSSGGQYVIAGGSISSLSNSLPSTFNAQILVRNGLLTLNPAAGSTTSGYDLVLASNLVAYDSAEGLVKNGTGTVLLLANNGLNAGTTINAGSLALGSNAVMSATTNIIIAAGANFDVSAVSAYTLGGSQQISGSGTVRGSVTDSSGSQFNPGGSAVGTLSITTNLTLVGGDTLNFNFTTNGNSVINIGGTLNPETTTTINLATWPTGGFVQTNYVLMQAASLGGSAANFALNNVPTGGRQTYNVVYNTSSSPQQVLLQVSGYNANLVWQGGAAWDVQISQDWLNGAGLDYFYTSDNVLFSNVTPANAYVNITPASISPGSIAINSTNSYLFTGGAIGGGASLTKNGSGTAILANANNTYTGGTTINAGTLQLGDNTNTQGSVTGNILNNGILAVAVPSGQTQTVNNNLTGTGQFVALGAGTLTLAGTNTLGTLTADGAELILTGSNSVTGGLLVNTGLVVATTGSSLANTPAVMANINTNGTLALAASGAYTFTNSVVGAGALVISNNASAIITLVSSNSLSGGVTLNGGILLVSNVNALGAGPVTIDNHANGLYSQIYLANGLNFTNPITLYNGSDYYDGLLMVNPGTGGSGGGTDTNGATFSGPITIGSGSLGHGSYFCGPIYGPGWLTIAGPVTTTGSSGLGIRNGRVLVSGGGSYTSIGLAQGLVGLSTNNGICTNAALAIAGSGGGTFDLRGYSQTLAGLYDGNTAYAGLVTNSSSTPVVLTLNVSSAEQFSGYIGGSLGLTLNAAGYTYVLAGTNTYTGNTILNAGTLQLNNATNVARSAMVFVSSNATLNVGSGSLTINTNQTLEGDGAFTINANLVNNGTIVLNVNKASGTVTGDSVNGLSGITYGGKLQLNLTGSSLASGDNITLFNAGSYAGTFTTIVPNTPGTGLAWDTSNLAVNGTLAVVATVSLTPTNIITTVTGTNLNLTWPADHTGWRLLVQTNNLSTGVSTNAADWGAVSGSAATNAVSVPIDPTQANEYYRLVYP